MPNTKKIFSVPFNTDFDTFPETIIEKYHEHIAEVYMPMPGDLAPNARGSHQQLTTETIVKFAKYLVTRKIRPVVVFNSTWTPIEMYADEYMREVIEQLKIMNAAGVSKIIVGNYYLVTSKIFEKNIPGLDVVASINSKHDTPDKLLAHVGFARPSSVYLDRSFNRKWSEFMHVSKALNMLGVEASVLANEGCLYACPFKTDHDVQIGMSAYKGEAFQSYCADAITKYDGLNDTIANLNETIGCCNVYKRNPWYMLKSPFIRPEDLDAYLPHISLVKIAGRNRSTEWIERCLLAYINRSYDGSILDLLDVADIQSLNPDFYPNKALDGVLEMTSKCHKVCISCGKCAKFFEEKCLGIESKQITEDDLNGELDAKLTAAAKLASEGAE